MVTSYGDGTNYCINYVVETFDTSDGKRGHMAKARPLSKLTVTITRLVMRYILQTKMLTGSISKHVPHRPQ